MLRHMSAETFIGWMQYAALEPFDEQRADLRAGIIASTIANVMGGRKGGKLFTPTDFMPFSEEPPPRRKTTDDLFLKAKLLNKLLGGKYVDNRQVQEVA